METPIDFREDGRIALDLNGDGKPVTLRIPKIKEFKELLAYAEELDDELKTVEHVGDALREPDKRNKVSDAEVAEWRAIRASVASRFVYKSVSVLGDRKPPEDIEDMPAFTQDMTLPGRFQNHWQTVPLGSSPRSNPNRSVTGR